MSERSERTRARHPGVQLEGLSAGYDAAAVVRDLDLHVGVGEVVALLGPNGAGKTTTLRAISGLIRPMTGVIRFDGDDLAKRSPAARAQLGIAHVPEGRGVFFGLTVAEHFRLGYRGERLDTDIAYTYFPALAALRDSAGGPAVGRRAADAHARRGAGAQAATDARRRAVARARPRDRRTSDAGRVDLRQAERLRRAARRTAPPHRATSPTGATCSHTASW